LALNKIMINADTFNAISIGLSIITNTLNTVKH